MRSVLPCLLLVAGCATPTDRPWPGAEAPLVAVRLPAEDPYRAPALGEFPALARIHAPRPRGWPDEGYREEVAALSSVVTIEVSRGTSIVTGPEAHAERVASWLADRARFEDARVTFEVRQGLVAADAFSFEALTPCDGALFAVVSTGAAWALVRDLPPGARVAVFDGQRAHVESSDRRAYIAGCMLDRHEHTGLVVRSPRVEVLTCARRFALRPHLASDGELVVLEWRQETSRSDDARDAHVWVRDAAGFTSVPVSLPRVHAQSLDDRFVLRADEALVLLEATTDQAEVLQLTVVTWRREG